MYYVYVDDELVYSDTNVEKAKLYAATIAGSHIDYDEGGC